MRLSPPPHPRAGLCKNAHNFGLGIGFSYISAQIGIEFCASMHRCT